MGNVSLDWDSSLDVGRYMGLPSKGGNSGKYSYSKSLQLTLAITMVIR
jgi:hypothetical protein